jgi:hypothetical protein
MAPDKVHRSAVSANNDDGVGNKFSQISAHGFRVRITQNAVRRKVGSKKAVNEPYYRGTGQVQNLFEHQVKNLSGGMFNKAPPFLPPYRAPGWKALQRHGKIVKIFYAT